jgi:hypothetical protein
VRRFADTRRLSRLGPAGLGVLAVVAAAVLASVSRLDNTFGVVDWRADQNASRGYLERIYGVSADRIGSRRVVEDARLWMPTDAKYRILVSPNTRLSHLAIGVATDFLRFFLLPRLESDDAPWIFCFDCNVAKLRDGFRQLSEDNGLSFWKKRT